MGSAPAGVQCPLTSSLGEFPGYWDWLWCPRLSPVLVSIGFSLRLSISLCFSIHSTSPAIEFHSCFFFTPNVSASTLHLLTFLGEFPVLGLDLVPDVVNPEVEQGCACSRN